jgi:hypothetical protein
LLDLKLQVIVREMFIVKKIQTSVAIFSLLIGLFTILIASSAYAATSLCPNGQAKLNGSGECVPIGDAHLDTNNCADQTPVPAATIDQGVEAVDQFCTDKGGIAALPGFAEKSEETELKQSCNERPLTPDNCSIIRYLVLFINTLTAIVGIVVVIMITFRGIQFAFSRDNPQMTKAAKDGIRDAVLALIIFLFISAFLQWLVPGGVL